MCLAQGPQPSEAQTRGPSVSSKALYHWATALPKKLSPLPLTYFPILAYLEYTCELQQFIADANTHTYLLLLTIFKINFLKKTFQEHYQNLKQFGSRLWG